MAVQTTRVARGERPTLIMPRSAELGPDEALVGSAEDAATKIVDDDENPYAHLKDEEWDGLDESQRSPGGRPGTGDRPPRGEARTQIVDDPPPRNGAGAGDGEEEDDEVEIRQAYDEDELERNRGRRSRRNRNTRMQHAQRDEELESLRAQVQELSQQQRRVVGGQIDQTAAQLETTIRNCDAALQVAQGQLAEAIAGADGVAAARILAERDRITAERWTAQNNYRRLEAQVEQMQRGGQPGGRAQPQGQQLTPEQRAEISEREEMFERRRDVFLDRYSWFDPDVELDDADADHAFVLRIDRRLAAEGVQRHTKAYWHEMEREMRAAGYRPETDEHGEDGRRDPPPRRRAREDADEELDRRPARRGRGGRAMDSRRYGGPPTGGVGGGRRPAGRQRGNGGGSYELSEIEHQMLQDEGLLEDGLSEADEAKKTRLINKWKSGKEQYERRTGRRW